MPLVIKQGQDFEPAPPGLHSAVCVDVVDLGVLPGPYGAKSKLKIVWQLKMRNKKGERFQVRATYTQSLYDGANLRRDLTTWRGRDFTPEELKEFDVENLLGVNCQLSVAHGLSKSTGRTYAKATVILPPLKGEKLVPENYEREPWAGETSKVEEPEHQADEDEDGDSVPF